MDLEFELTVNGKAQHARCDPGMTLAGLLRGALGWKGVKLCCDTGECGACTVLLDGKPVLACLTLAALAEGREVTTIEGLMPAHMAAGGEGADPVQDAFDRTGALQCGFCQPGMMLSARALLDANPEPSRTEIKDALAGNLCRCMGYTQIVQAVELAIAESVGTEPAAPAWTARPAESLEPGDQGGYARSARSLRADAQDREDA